MRKRRRPRPDRVPVEALSPDPPSDPGPLSGKRILLLAVGFGVWTGMAEGVPIFLSSFAGVVAKLGRHHLWMTPLADVLLFGMVGCLLILAGSRWPRAASRSAVMGTFWGLAVLALGLLLESLHPAAVLLLAIGAGVQIGRSLKGPVRRPRVLPVLALAGIATVLGLTARSEWKRHVWEDTWLEWLPAPHQGASNVLLVILDTVRGASVDFLTDLAPQSEWAPVHAPTLSALAEKSVVFTRAMAPSPWTFPSHASMFTGRWPHELEGDPGAHSQWIQGLDPRFPTLAETLARNGYLTAGFVGNLVFTAAETGLVRGFLTYEDYEVTLRQVALSSAVGRRLAGSDGLRRLLRRNEVLNRKSAERVADQFLAWHDRQVDRPYFAFLNFFDAHEPYPTPDSLKSALPPGSEWNDFAHSAGLFTGSLAWRNEKWTLDPAERELLARGYHEGILRGDRALGRILTELEARGDLGNTVVIVAGDHGEQLGEHGLFHHNNSLYLPLLHVPLLILDPREEAVRKQIREVVSLRDMAATVLDLAGVGAGAGGVGGRSLAPLWRGGERGDTVLAVLERWGDQQSWYPAYRGNTMYSLIDTAHHYILNGDDVEELYGIREDPMGLRNLVTDSLAARVLPGYRSKLRELLGGG